MNADHKSANMTHYRRLLLMAILSYIAMFALMYAMVDAFANVYVNVNQFYMAGLMAAPMVIIEKQARITDPEIKDLCRIIGAGQQAEIDWMKRKLAELEK